MSDFSDRLEGHSGDPDADPAADDPRHRHDRDYREGPELARYLLTHRDERPER